MWKEGLREGQTDKLEPGWGRMKASGEGGQTEGILGIGGQMDQGTRCWRRTAARPGPGRGRARRWLAREVEAERERGVCGAVGCGGIMKNSRHRSRPSASIRGDGT